MTLILYQTLDGKNKLEKTLLNEKVITGFCKTAFDLIAPSITLELKDGLQIENYNYCYISDVNKYYFIEQKLFLSSRMCVIQLSIDVLMTYKNQLLESTVKISQSNINEPYKMSCDLMDDNQTKKIEFQNPFKDIEPCNVLIAVNGNAQITLE